MSIPVRVRCIEYAGHSSQDRDGVGLPFERRPLGESNRAVARDGHVVSVVGKRDLGGGLRALVGVEEFVQGLGINHIKQRCQFSVVDNFAGSNSFDD